MTILSKYLEALANEKTAYIEPSRKIRFKELNEFYGELVEVVNSDKINWEEKINLIADNQVETNSLLYHFDESIDCSSEAPVSTEFKVQMYMIILFKKIEKIGSKFGLNSDK